MRLGKPPPRALLQCEQVCGDDFHLLIPRSLSKSCSGSKPGSRHRQRDSRLHVDQSQRPGLPLLLLRSREQRQDEEVAQVLRVRELREGAKTTPCLSRRPTGDTTAGSQITSRFAGNSMYKYLIQGSISSFSSEKDAQEIEEFFKVRGNHLLTRWLLIVTHTLRTRTRTIANTTWY